MLDLMFYSVCGACLLATLYFSKIPFVSFTGIYLRLVLILVYVPAYYVYRGGMFYTEGSNISLLVYVLLLTQIIASCFSAHLAWHTRLPVVIRFHRKQSSRNYTLILTAVIVYAGVYMYHFFDKIPLFELLRGDFSATVASRSELTHGFSGDEGRFFAYFRPITKDLLFMLIFVLILKYRANKKVVVALTLIISFVLLAHLEKSYALMIMLALWTSRAIFKKASLKDELYLSIGGFVLAVSVIYGFFASSLSDAISYVPLRLMAQIGYIPEQLKLSQAYGPLLLRGMNLGLLNRATGIEFVDVSRMAWEEIHSSDSALGLSGSSAGLAACDAYMILGAIGLVALLCLLYAHFYIDKLLRMSIMPKGKEAELNYGALAFYIYFLSFYPLSLIGSLLGIFALPYVVQPGLLLCCMAVVAINKVTVLRLQAIPTTRLTRGGTEVYVRHFPSADSNC